MEARKAIKNAVKVILSDTFHLPIEQIKMSKSLKYGLNLTNEQLEMLKPIFIARLNVKVSKSDIKDCYDVDDLVELIADELDIDTTPVGNTKGIDLKDVYWGAKLIALLTGVSLPLDFDVS